VRGRPSLTDSPWGQKTKAGAEKKGEKFVSRLVEIELDKKRW